MAILTLMTYVLGKLGRFKHLKDFGPSKSDKLSYYNDREYVKRRSTNIKLRGHSSFFRAYVTLLHCMRLKKAVVPPGL